jgi:WD40 repeat protein/serine/threonine protein kinase/tetratricopeptide (TPR) repeat protein
MAMTELQTCAQGHHWSSGKGAPQTLVCPECGMPALEMTTDDRGQRPAEKTTDLSRPRDSVPSGTGEPPVVSEGVGVPGYEILGELGRGGMGVVYKARQVQLNRAVALKMILHGAHAGAEEVARFRSEAKAVARLQHPNIVQIYEVGEWRGPDDSPPLPYCALEYVDGGSLAQKLAGTPLAAGAAADMSQKLARAVHAAHQHGVIHRDLKPANILLQPDKETGRQGDKERGASSVSLSPCLAVSLSSAVPKITDFGLAKRMDEDSGQTRSGAILGTPSYMAPEQAAGQSKAIGPAADIYALGAMLYEMLTGRPPFSGATILETLLQVQLQEPVPPSRLAPSVPRDLETICLKCLQKIPGRRYGSADMLAEDLRRFLAGEPITARPVGRAERLWRWAKREPWVAGLGAAVALSLLIGAAVSLYYGLEASAKARLAIENEGKASTNLEIANTQKAEADTQKARAEAGERLAKGRLYASQMREALRAADEGNLPRVLALLEDQRPRFDEEDLRGFEWYHLWRRCHPGFLRGLRGTGVLGEAHEATVTHLSFSPDGKQLAVASDRSVRLFDVATGRQDAVLQDTHSRFVTFSPDGRILAATSGQESCNIRLYDAATRRVIRTLYGRPSHRCGWVAFRRDGKTLATTNERLGLVKFWDVDTGRERGAIAIPGAWYVAFSADGRALAAASAPWFSPRVTKLWSWESGPGRDPAPRLRAELLGVTRPIFTPDSKVLVTGQGEVRLWDVESGKPLVAAHKPPGQDLLAVSPASATLALAQFGGRVLIWDRATGCTRSGVGGTRCAAFAPDGRTLAVPAGAASVELWDLRAEPEPTVLHAPEKRAESLALSPDGKLLASGHADGTVKLVDLGAKGERASLTGHLGPVKQVLFSPDGKTLAVLALPRGDGSFPAQIKCWNIARGQSILLGGTRGNVLQLVFTPDSRTLLCTRLDQGPPQSWDVATGRELTVLANLPRVVSLAFSPDGRTAIAGGIFGLVQLADVTTGQVTATLQSQLSNVRVDAVAFAADGKRVAAARSGIVKVWDTVSGELHATLAGHTEGITSLMFFADGRTLLSCGSDGTVKFWDLPTRQERTSLRGVAGAVMAADGSFLVTRGWGGAVILWRATARPEALARRNELGTDDSDSPLSWLVAAEMAHAGGRQAEAEQLVRKSLARLGELAAAFPGRPEYRQHQGTAHILLGRVHQASKQLDSAKQCFDNARRLLEELAKQQPGIPAYRRKLGLALLHLGWLHDVQQRPQDAEQAFRQAFALDDRLAIELATPDPLGSRDSKEAADFARQLLEAISRVRERDDANVLELTSWLASLHDAQKKGDEAKALFLRVLEGRRRTLGLDHPHTLDAAASLCELLLRANKGAEAEPFARQALQMHRRLRGADHPESFHALLLLGEAIDKQSRVGAAEPIWREALDRCKRCLGPEHDWTQQARNNLAASLFGQLKWAEAEAHFRDAVDQSRKWLAGPDRILGPGRSSSLALTHRMNLIVCLSMQGKHAQAEILQRELLESYRRVYGAEHPQTLKALVRLGAVVEKQQKWSQLEMLVRELWLTRRRVLAPNHADTLDALAILISTIERQGRKDEATALAAYRTSVARDPKTPLPKAEAGRILAAQEVRRAEASLRSRDWQKVVTDCDAAIKHAPDNGLAWFLRGVARNHLNQWEQAAADFDKAAQLGEAGPGDQQSEPARALRVAAGIQVGRGEQNKALASYNRCAVILERLVQKQPQNAWLHNEYAWTFEPRARLHEAQGRRKEAEADFAAARAERITWLELGKSDSVVRDTFARHVCHHMAFSDTALWADVARHAVKLWPTDAACWTALGLVEYRLGRWPEADAALEKSLALRAEGDGLTWFYACMSRWKLDKKQAAGQAYDRGVGWLAKNKPWLEKHAVESGPVRAAHEEAAKMLGIKKSAASNRYIRALERLKDVLSDLPEFKDFA